MNKSDVNTDTAGLFFNSLSKSLCDSQHSAGVSFDRDLRILDFTPLADQWLNLKSRIDITLETSADDHNWKNWTEIIQSVITSGQTVTFEAVKISAQGRTRLLDMVFAPVRKPKEESVVGGGLMIKDVTERVAHYSELAQTERLAAMGKVGGRVAHELNNPLDGILRYVNLALRALDAQPDKTREYLQHCRDGLMRMVKIVGEMLEFSRGSHTPFEKEPLDKVVEEALAAMAGVLENIQVQIERRYEGPARSVLSEAMFQVFCNLIKNAADAMGGTGTLTIRLAKTDSGWQAAFQDTGGGFDPSQADDMFRPFFTTKPPGRGTGLGLAICRDILEKVDGTIEAQNIRGGSEFTITLPDK